MRLFAPSSLVLLLSLLLACGTQTLSPGISLDTSFRNLVWPNTSVLAGVDMQSLERSRLYTRYLQKLSLPALDESSQRLGFDPRRDVQQLLLEMDGQRSLLLVKGNINITQIRERLGASGAKTTAYRSVQLLGDDRNTLALLDRSLAIGGSAQAVRSALDLRSDDKGTAVAESLQQRLDAIPKASQIWIASNKGLPFTELPMRSDVQSALSNIVSYISGTTAGLQVSDGLRLDAKLDCISPEGAQRVHDALRGTIGLARLTTKDSEAGLLKVYDAIKVEQTGTSVSIKADLSGADVDQLAVLLPQVRERVGQIPK